jgi:hypothetical protein
MATQYETPRGETILSQTKQMLGDKKAANTGPKANLTTAQRAQLELTGQNPYPTVASLARQELVGKNPFPSKEQVTAGGEGGTSNTIATQTPNDGSNAALSGMANKETQVAKVPGMQNNLLTEQQFQNKYGYNAGGAQATPFGAFDQSGNKIGGSKGTMSVVSSPFTSSPSAGFSMAQLGSPEGRAMAGITNTPAQPSQVSRVSNPLADKGPFTRGRYDPKKDPQYQRMLAGKKIMDDMISEGRGTVTRREAAAALGAMMGLTEDATKQRGQNLTSQSALAGQQNNLNIAQMNNQADMERALLSNQTEMDKAALTNAYNSQKLGYDNYYKGLGIQKDYDIAGNKLGVEQAKLGQKAMMDRANLALKGAELNSLDAWRAVQAQQKMQGQQNDLLGTFAGSINAGQNPEGLPEMYYNMLQQFQALGQPQMTAEDYQAQDDNFYNNY